MYDIIYRCCLANITEHECYMILQRELNSDTDIPSIDEIKQIYKKINNSLGDTGVLLIKRRNK